MKYFVLVLLFAFAAADVEYYRTADDYLDMDALMTDLPRLQSFVDCFLDRAPCSEVPASYKKIIHEVVKTACKKCNPAQKRLANRFSVGLKATLPEEYKNFRRKYDPENKYYDYLEKTVSTY